MERSFNNRLAYIDIARGIGIILVVAGHVISSMGSGRYTLLYNLIYSMHMPFFFLLCGLTFHITPTFFSFFKKKAKSLLLPTYLFSTIFILIMSLLSQWDHYFSTLYPTFTVSELLRGVLCFRDSFISQWWFLPSLMIAELLLYFICKIESIQKQCAIIICIFIASLTYTYFWNIPLPFCTEEALFAIPFIWCGITYKKHIQSKNIPFKTIFFIGIPYLLTIFIFQIVGFGNLYMWKMDIDHILLFTLSSLLASYLLIRVSLLLPPLRLLTFLGRNSLFIYGIHFIFLFIFYYIYQSLAFLNISLFINIMWNIVSIIFIILL